MLKRTYGENYVARHHSHTKSPKNGHTCVPQRMATAFNRKMATAGSLPLIEVGRLPTNASLTSPTVVVLRESNVRVLFPGYPSTSKETSFSGRTGVARSRILCMEVGYRFLPDTRFRHENPCVKLPRYIARTKNNPKNAVGTILYFIELCCPCKSAIFISAEMLLYYFNKLSFNRDTKASSLEQTYVVVLYLR